MQCCVTSPPYYGLRDYGISGQLGLEPTPDEYVQNLVNVFREVWRVMKDDGTLWVNLGDSFCNSNGFARADKQWQRDGRNSAPANDRNLDNLHASGLKTKDLIGIPWMVAFALRADGWYLRSDIIWSKPNPMPESVTDRPTKAHEYLFLLTKSPRYYFDQDAVREKHSREWWNETVNDTNRDVKDRNDGGNRQGNGTPAGRNIRSVWTIATQPTSYAHFATFPEKLVEPCILAGSRPGDLILDPFSGSGTTGRVAIRHNRQFIGTELNFKYIHEISHKRMTVNPVLF